MRTFVIGDVHGHADRLLALLQRADVVGREDVQIVQLGDLGHFGEDSAAGDEAALSLAVTTGMIVLWGNHDRAVVDPDHHWFRGFKHPGAHIQDYLEEQVRPFNAFAADGYLLTHAGLHPAYVGLPHMDHLSAEGWAHLLNTLPFDAPVMIDIGQHRGGYAKQGGIFWRDAREPLYNGVKQVFGHTKGFVRSYNNGRSFCIDTGDKHNGSLVGMWLDTGEFVAVGPDAAQFEKYPPVEQ